MKAEETPGAEIVAALLKGVVSTIPIVGGVASEVGNLYLNPLEKRKKQWAEEVCRAIEDIRARFSRLPASLEADESFVSFLYQATIVAIKNHQREKLEALGNALVSAADPDGVSEDMRFQFLRFVDELSPTHLNVLSGLEGLTRQLREIEGLEDVHDRFVSVTGSSLDRATFRAFLNDLDTRFLIRMGDIDDLPEYTSKVSYVLEEESTKRHLEVTYLGRQFLCFIRQAAL